MEAKTFIEQLNYSYSGQGMELLSETLPQLFGHKFLCRLKVTKSVAS